MNRPVLLDFWAEWCGPCTWVSAVVEEIADEYDLDLQKVNVDEDREMMDEYGVRSVPTLILVDDDEVRGRVTGSNSKDALVAALGLLDKE